MKPHSAPDELTKLLQHLTHSQLRVLALLSQGNNLPKIAALLFTSVSAVRKQRERILERLNMKHLDQDALILYALERKEILRPYAEDILSSRRPPSDKK